MSLREEKNPGESCPNQPNSRRRRRSGKKEVKRLTSLREEHPDASCPNQPNSSKGRRRRRKKVKWSKHYSSNHPILLVGEGGLTSLREEESPGASCPNQPNSRRRRRSGKKEVKRLTSLREEENPGASCPNQPNSSKRRSRRRSEKKEVKWLKHCSSNHGILLVGEGGLTTLREEENPPVSPNQPNSSRRKSRRKKSGKKEVKWLKHYSSDHRILLVGEGDFSFSHSLGMAFGDASNIVATSLDSYDVVIKKYKGAKTNLEILHSLGAKLLHEVDALQMKLHRDLQKQKFDRIIFNFPHAGFWGPEDVQRVIMIHRILVCGFFKNASGMLHPKGEVHVTHKTSYPFQSWNINELATQNSLTLLERVKFRLEDYPGYNNKRGDGDRSDSSFPLGECSTYKFVFFLKGARSGSSGGGNKFSQQVQPLQQQHFSPQQYRQQVTQRPFGSFFAGLQPSGALGSTPHYFPAQPFPLAPQQAPSLNLFGQPKQYPTATYGSAQQLPLASLAQGQQSQPTAMPAWSTYGHAQPNSWPSYTPSPTPLYGEQGATPTDLASVFSSMNLQSPQPDPIYHMDTGASSHMTYNLGY